MARRIIIPARYASTRLPKKLLIEINGKTILEHTYWRAVSCGFDSVLIATDHPAIVSVANQIGAPVCLTNPDHLSGSDRCAEAMQIHGYQDDDIILNLQGDEPLIPKANILKVVENLEKYPAAMVATLCEVITDQAEIFNPTYPKVVFDREHYALYFSRAPIPWARDSFPNRLPDTMCFHRHIGLYAYRGRFLRDYPTLCHSPLEKIELLEQLRVLWNGYKIHVDFAPEVSLPGVDNEESLRRVASVLQSEGKR